MMFKKRINNIRRRLMRRITKQIGSSYSEPSPGDFGVDDFNKILIIRPNHRLGNQLLLTPFVQEISNTFPNAHIHLFVKGGVAYPVFENYKAVKKIIQLPRKPFNHLFKYAKVWISIKKDKYDLVVNADKNSSSGRLLTQLSNAKLKVFGESYNELNNKNSDYKHISKYPIYNLRYYLGQLGFDKSENKFPILDIKLNEKEISNGKEILDKIINNNKKTICIYTNATGNKCYSEAWWESFYSRLLKEFPNYNIIEMLPIENISKINFKAPHFYSKDIREMGAIIKNTSIFIAADNGVMHLASASLTPTVGFFAFTDEDIYGPYGNGSIALNTNTTHMEDWITEIRAMLQHP